jgi:hypothetical protein
MNRVAAEINFNLTKRQKEVNCVALGGHFVRCAVAPTQGGLRKTMSKLRIAGIMVVLPLHLVSVVVQ